MTEEEKKAIEDLRKLCIDVLREDELLTYNNYSPSEKMTMVHIVLNLVKKQQEEIEDLKWKNEIYVKSIKSYKREIEKKDEIIDLMAIYLADIDFDECCAEIPEPCLGCSWEDYELHTNCIKRYFENKVEGSK